MARMIKLTFLGDAMCQMQQISAIRRTHSAWDEVFSGVKHLWKDSDVVSANLETPVTGPGFRLCFEEIRFNAPTEFLQALKSSGVGFVSLANNHILDRGPKGLRATLRQVRDMGLTPVGIYDDHNLIDDIVVTTHGGFRIAWLSCTYDTNAGRKSDMLPVDERWHIDYVHQPTAFLGSFLFSVKRTVKSAIPYAVRSWLKRGRRDAHSGWSRPQLDSFPLSDTERPENKSLLETFCDKIRKAKEVSDFVVVLPHIGGQYNLAVGPWQKTITETIVNAGADLVVTNHAHTPLPVEMYPGNVLVANALGNLCFTPRVGFYNDQCQADYSIALNCWIDCDKRALVRSSFHVLKTVTRSDRVSVIKHVQESDQEADIVCRRVTGRLNQECKTEVEL